LVTRLTGQLVPVTPFWVTMFVKVAVLVEVDWSVELIVLMVLWVAV
jgi:hypothetical protein